jgi:hypothetical protein
VVVICSDDYLQSQPSLTFWYRVVRVRLPLAADKVSEDSFDYQKAALAALAAAAAGTQPGSRENGAEKKRGGGGG